MNHILNYKGYRFFQSSYDEDEKGSILWVSHDWWGTTITYVGYILLLFGVLATLFNPNSRFHLLLREYNKLRIARRIMLILGIIIVSTQIQAQEIISVEKSQKKDFEQLLVQNHQGRIEPVLTLASEVLWKVAKKDNWQGLSPIEFFLNLNVNSSYWKNQAIIKVSDVQLQEQLGIKGSYISFNDLLGTESRVDLLRRLINQAYQKNTGAQTRLDKEVININERLNICYQIFQGEFLRIYPQPNDSTFTWVTEKRLREVVDTAKLPVKNMSLRRYFQLLKANSIDQQSAKQILANIRNYQQINSARIIPSNNKIKLEILYNRIDIFWLMAKVCASAGLILLVLYFVNTFSKHKLTKKAFFYFFVIVSLVFLIYSLAMTLRWYISGHAPWSNGYETLLFIGWTTLLSGLIFMRKSPVTLAATTILTALVLLVVRMSGMNPEITNLVPVLKSYWLIIHVAIVTASYGFLATGSLLGLTCLVLMILKNQKNHLKISLDINELIYVIQLVLTIGLILLTAGSFIGAVWANQSWGRYWGWDPKETWALITILVYVFVLHIHKISGMNRPFVISSLAFASFASVLMTFFGVNYYLSGKHSYAQGDAVSVPIGVYIAIFIAAIIIFLANISEKKHHNNVFLLEKPDNE